MAAPRPCLRSRPGPKPTTAKKGAEEIRQALQSKLDASLKAIGSDYIDILLYHDALDENLLFHSETMKFFSDSKNNGVIKACGFSTHNEYLNLHSRNNAESFYDIIMVPFNHKGSFVHSVSGRFSEWNQEITDSLLKGAYDTLLKSGTSIDNILVEHVPGSFEIPYAARLIAEKMKPDAVICLGCVIQGETRHFDFICQAVTQGITELNLRYNNPFIFGILTTQNIDQARERAGGKHGNKGIEAAITAIKMVALRRKFGD